MLLDVRHESEYASARKISMNFALASLLITYLTC